MKSAKAMKAAKAAEEFSKVHLAKDEIAFANSQDVMLASFKDLMTYDALLQGLLASRSGAMRWDTAFNAAVEKDLKHLSTLDGCLRAELVLVDLGDEMGLLLHKIKKWVEMNIGVSQDNLLMVKNV